MHQRQNRLAEVLKIGGEIVEGQLHAIATDFLQVQEMVDDLFGRADDMQVASE